MLAALCAAIIAVSGILFLSDSARAQPCIEVDGQMVCNLSMPSIVLPDLGEPWDPNSPAISGGDGTPSSWEALDPMPTADPLESWDPSGDTLSGGDWPGPSSNGRTIRATRTFVEPQDYPPQQFAAYGVVAFPVLSTSRTRDRYVAVCRAYWAALQDAGSSRTPLDEQMVTVWPVSTRALAEQIIADNDPMSGCELATDHYDLGTGQLAVEHANDNRNPQLRGIGPYLLAWSPSSAKGRPGAPVLVFDMSGATTEAQYIEYFMTWRDSIQRRPDLWHIEDGWSIEKVRRLVREFADSTGKDILNFLVGRS